jgi:hypothetical protein
MNDNHEIQRAEKHLDDMANAKLISDYEASWQEFLYRLERIWERGRLHYAKENWYPKLYGPYAKLRKKDPLIKYLKQARNAETHTIAGTISSPLSVQLKEKYGRPFSIKYLETTFEDGVLTVSIDTQELFFDFDTKISRDAPQLTRFKSRRDWYNPPTSHLGNTISSRNPILVGKLGLETCKSFLTELHEKKMKIGT